MTAFIDKHRDTYGVEPICKALPIAPATYYRYRQQQSNLSLRCSRNQRDELLCKEIRRIWEENLQVYGVRKVWRQLKLEGIVVARCTVERLMRQMGLQGSVKGKPINTTISDHSIPYPPNRPNRQFHGSSPATLWIADLTVVATQQGFVYVVFIIDVFARRIVGWRVSSSTKTDFVLDALEQALPKPPALKQDGLIHHNDSDITYISIHYTKRLADAGIEPSVGCICDSRDNTLAETINDLYKTEVINDDGPWLNRQAVEWATLEWVNWFNHRRLLHPIGNLPPAEAAYYLPPNDSSIRYNPNQ